MKWLYKLDYKYGRYAINNIMYYITAGMIVTYILDIVLPRAGIIDSIYGALYFNWHLIMQGQVWRLITFIFLYPGSNMFSTIISLYFYYYIGTSLEQAWGSFRFNAYYLFGIICTIISGAVMGITTNEYLNLSLFFAYATLMPDTVFSLFFILPIKVKYLAYLDAAFFIVSLITVSWGYKIALLVAIGNYFLFFSEDFINRIKMTITHIKAKRNFRR